MKKYLYISAGTTYVTFYFCNIKELAKLKADLKEYNISANTIIKHSDNVSNILFDT